MTSPRFSTRHKPLSLLPEFHTMACMRPTFAGLLLTILLLMACGQHARDNPIDPDGENSDQEGAGIELIASLPDGDLQTEQLAEFRYEVSELNAQGKKVILAAGAMNLVGESARGLAQGVPVGEERVFRVDAYDRVQIRTFSAQQVVEVGNGYPQVVLFQLERLKGELELTAELPPEIDSLEVVIGADADSVHRVFGADQTKVTRIQDIPTGSGISIILRARDQDGQVLFQRQTAVDIRDGLLARISLSIEIGALQVVAFFPDYISIAQVDRFSDMAGYIFRRSELPDLPGPGEPIDFDQERFFFRGFGPDGERVQFYNFDVRGNLPPPVYIPVDRRDEPIAGQLPIFDLLPGDEGHSDLWHINYVHIEEGGFKPNSLTSLQGVLDGEYEITPTGEVMNGVMVPPGSSAARRFDPAVPAAPLDGWYRGQIVKYLLFEHPQSSSTVTFEGERVVSAEMYAFLENDRNFLDGFARDPNDPGLTTHNVVTRLPGTEADYTPLWLLRVLKLNAFEQVANSINATQQIPENLHTLDGEQLRINAPIVGME